MASQGVNPRPSVELIAFAERQIRNVRQFKNTERRSDKRSLMVVPVVLQPVNEDLEPDGEKLAAVTRDISATGVGLIHTKPIARRRFKLQMSLCNEQVNLVTELFWCTSLGPFYYLGGKFVAKLDCYSF